MSTDRRFPIVAVPYGDDGKLRSVAQIICDACGATGRVPCRAKKKFSPDAIARLFRAKGWLVGIGAFSDRCPTCEGSARLQKIQQQPKEPATMVVAAKTTPSKAAATPRVLEPTERRLIYEKLSDVYDDGAGGYVQGWNEKRVAEDLGCPRAWVTEVREQMFGTLQPSPEVRALLADAEARLKAAEACSAKAATICEKLEGRGNAYLDEAVRLRDELKELQADVAVQREVLRDLSAVLLP